LPDPDTAAIAADPFDSEVHSFDAPAAPGSLSGQQRPFGAVDPSMYHSTRYRKFRDKVKALRASLPDDLEQFATYDLPELKDRQWLTRFCIKQEAGTLSAWQQIILEQAGFNWVRGRPPQVKAPKPSSPQPSAYELRWQQKYDQLAAACAADNRPWLGLLLCEDAPFDWLCRQLIALKEDRLSAERLEKLRALPFDLDVVRQEPGFRRWRTSFKAYREGRLQQPRRWAVQQALQRETGALPQWRIDALDALGFDWQVNAAASTRSGVRKSKQERMEDRWRAKLEQYCALHAASGQSGPLPVDADPSLRPWISRMRSYYNKGLLRPELIEAFKAKGFEFDGRAARRRSWQQFYRRLVAFKEKFGHAQVPSSYCDDPALGKWFAIQQERMRKGKLPPEKLQPLLELGVVARNAVARPKVQRSHISPWLKIFNQILAILTAEHGGRLPAVGRFSEPHKAWMKRQAKKIESGLLEPWQLEKLDSIGFDLQHLPEPPPQVDWGDRLERLRRFIQEHGHARVPRGHPDRKLGAFVETIRERKRKGKLSQSEQRVLRESGFIFTPLREVTPAWKRLYAELQQFHQREGHSHVPRAYPRNQPLAEFVAQQRQRGRKGLLLAEHIRLLDALDFRWSGGHPVPKDET